MRSLVCMLLLSCGRYQFAPSVDDADADSATVVDAAPCLPLANCADGEAFRCSSGTCYALCRVPADQPTQDLRCRMDGAHLAVIRSAADDQCIEAHMGAAPTWYWIGLTQMTAQSSTSSGWSWTTLDPIVYANWYDPDPTPPGNPDDFDGVEDGREQCGWKNAPPIVQWEDAGCDNGNPGVICER